MLTLSGGIDLLITQLMNERQTKMKCECVNTELSILTLYKAAAGPTSV